MPQEVVQAQSLADSGEWSIESGTELFSGVNISNAHGATVASIVVVYPKREFDTHSSAVVKNIATTTLGLLVIFSAESGREPMPRLPPIMPMSHTQGLP